MRTIVSFLLDNLFGIAVFFITLSIFLMVTIGVIKKKLAQAKTRAEIADWKFEFLSNLTHPTDSERRLRFPLITYLDARDLKTMYWHILDFIKTRITSWDARRLGEAVNNLGSVHDGSHSMEYLKSLMSEAIAGLGVTILGDFLFRSVVARVSYVNDFSKEANSYNIGIGFVLESLSRWERAKMNSLMDDFNKRIQAKEFNNESDDKTSILLKAEALKVSSLFNAE